MVHDIDNGTLRINGSALNGKYGSLVYINNHNSIDDAIFLGYWLNISIDIAGYSSASSGRQMAVYLGQSLAD